MPTIEPRNWFYMPVANLAERGLFLRIPVLTKAERDLITALPWEKIKAAANRHTLDAYEVAGFICQESRGDAHAIRFEPGYKYTVAIAKNAKANGISQATERMLQKSSFGLLQFMGGVARQMGYSGQLGACFGVDLNLELGCKNLRQVFDRHVHLGATAAAYNAGSARKLKNGKWENQAYVDGVIGWIEKVHDTFHG